METATYEIVYIVDNDAGDLADIQQKLTELIGGKVEKTEKLGHRKFAYPIKKKESGHYFLLQAVVEKPRIVEFKKRVRQIKEILRCLVINLDNEKHFRYPKPRVFPQKTENPTSKSSVDTAVDKATEAKNPEPEATPVADEKVTVKTTTETAETPTKAETEPKADPTTKTVKPKKHLLKRPNKVNFYEFATQIS